MQRFLLTLLLCSVTMSILVLLYIWMTPLLAKRYSIRSRYYTWLVIVIGLIIPFRPQFHPPIVGVSIPNHTIIPMIQGENHTFTPIKHTISNSISNITMWQIAGVIWLVGMVVFLASHAIKHYRFMKFVSRWSVNITNTELSAIMQELKIELGLTKNIGLQFCDSILSPMMIGFIHPRILLSNAEFTKEEFRFIIKHELIHYKRYDLWYKSLILIATGIHWFNPIIYFMAKMIDIQCELSCDEAVIRNADADTRLHYSETIIGAAKYQSKQKTVLSTNFYGGKKGMKKRIFSIMDMSKKRTGIIVFCGVLVFTLGTGFAFEVNAGINESIKEDITISTDNSLVYRFLPDPELYSQYASYGITISDDGKQLLFNRQRVRLFVDEPSVDETFFLDETGTMDLSVIRNATGDITGIESISLEKAEKYRSDFFADDIDAISNTQNTDNNKYQLYSKYGIVLSSNGDILQYNGQRVKTFVDQLSDGSFHAFWTDNAGIINLSVTRNTNGKITAVENITEEMAKEYTLAAKTYEQKVLDELEDAVVKKINELY